MSEIIIYQGQANDPVAVRLEGETVDNVGLHFRNVFESGELEELAATEEFSVVPCKRFWTI